MGDASDRALLIRAARLYYEDELTQEEVGELIGVPRIKVTRLLAEARRSGVVSIHVEGADRPFAEEEETLRKTYGLERCWIAATSGSERRTRAALARAGASALTELVSAAEIVAVGLSSAVVCATRALSSRPESQSHQRQFVPLGGSWGESCDGVGPHELAAMLARKFRGVAQSFPAPLLAGSASAARTFNEDPAVTPAIDMTRRADVMVVGVGGPPGRQMGLLSPLVGVGEFEELARLGAVGDVFGRFFDYRGNHLSSHLDERVVGASFDDLKNIQHRLAIAFGSEKVHPVRAAMVGGIVNNVVTDLTTAKRLLAMAGVGGRQLRGYSDREVSG